MEGMEKPMRVIYRREKEIGQKMRLTSAKSLGYQGNSEKNKCRTAIGLVLINFGKFREKREH